MIRLKNNVEFTGRLPYSEMIRRITECDIAVNPIMHGVAKSIIIKVGDYAMVGLSVISTQDISLVCCLRIRSQWSRKYRTEWNINTKGKFF